MEEKSNLKQMRRLTNGEKKQPCDFKIGYYTLLFLDVLSQKEALMKIDRLPENDEEMKEFTERLRKSFGVLDFFRKLFETTYKNIVKEAEVDAPTYARLSKEKRFLRVNIHRQLFSDSMIYYTSMMDDNPDFFPITGINTLLFTAALTFIQALSEGVVFRGGIEAGIASEFFEGEIYGPAIYQVYRLENEMAQYPRIVVGKELCDYITGVCQIAGDDQESVYQRFVAEICQKMLCHDVDGLVILDYLGEEVKTVIGNELDLDMREFAKKALAFVEKEWKRFGDEGNSKLAGRYFLLHRYILDRQEKFWL